MYLQPLLKQLLPCNDPGASAEPDDQAITNPDTAKEKLEALQNPIPYKCCLGQMTSTSKPSPWVRFFNSFLKNVLL